MKISCTQENISQGLSIVGHIANKNLNLPVLANILFKAEDKILTLSTTNLEIGITTQARGKVEKDGSFTIDAKLIGDYILLLPKERVDLELLENELKIECKKQKTKIKTQSANDFPLIPKIKKENQIVISLKDFKNAISSVIFAAANLEIRPEISGVFINISKEKMTLAATDSYRLAENKINIIEGSKEDKKVIVPVKTLQEVSRVLGLFKDGSEIDNSDNLEIYISSNQIMFSYNGVDIVSRLIDGQYPDYGQIIPTQFKTTCKVNCQDLVKAVKSSILFTKSGIYDLKMEFNPGSKELIINSSSSQTGENTSILEADITGEKNNIVMNCRYLLDGLQVINTETAVIEMNDSNNPCLLRLDNGDSYLYIIMPIKQ